MEHWHWLMFCKSFRNKKYRDQMGSTILIWIDFVFFFVLVCLCGKPNQAMQIKHRWSNLQIGHIWLELKSTDALCCTCFWLTQQEDQPSENMNITLALLHFIALIFLYTQIKGQMIVCESWLFHRFYVDKAKRYCLAVLNYTALVLSHSYRQVLTCRTMNNSCKC